MGLSFKKVKKGIKKSFKVVKKATAVTTLGVIAPAKAITWAGSKTGVKALQKLDTAVGKELKDVTSASITHLQVGAVVGSAIAGGSSIAELAKNVTPGPKVAMAEAQESVGPIATPGPKISAAAKSESGGLFDWFIEWIESLTGGKK